MYRKKPSFPLRFLSRAGLGLRYFRGVGVGAQPKASSLTPGDELLQDSIQFDSGGLAMQSKSIVDLLRSLFILKLCTWGTLVDNSEKLLNLCKKVFGTRFYEKIVGATFYKQFVAGESERDVKQVAANLQQHNMNCMFCVPAEDVSSDGKTHGFSIIECNYETNLKLMLDCVDLTAYCSGCFAQSKITPVVNTNIMFEVAKLLENQLSDHDTRPPHLSVERWAEALDKNQEGILVPELSEAFNNHLKQSLRRLNILGNTAQEKGVKLMFDAEYTFLQVSIDTIILALQKKFNKESSLVYNTYQCYRKDTPSRLQNDIELAQKHNFKIACKLVRGAYMDFERRRATEHGYPDPICDTYEETGRNYKKAMDLMLSVVAQNQGEVMFATHNEECILYGVKRVKELGIRSDAVSFGQIYGMCDHISYNLGNAGYPVHKSVPYGTLEHSILYLIRRAQENKSVMARTSKERGILVDEIIRRIKRPLGMA